MSKPQRFRALLKPDGTNLNWIVAAVPFFPEKAWPQRRGVRVRGTINGFAFRTSLFGSAEKGYVVLVNKTMQKGAQTGPGEMALFILEPDLEDREIAVPSELASLLKQDRAMKKWFEALSPSYRKSMAAEVSAPKSAEARTRRAAQVAERILLAMDGEQELPPILRVLFRRTPGAERAWHAMTPIQRRAHLLGIFYYRSPEARERRAKKAVEEALRIAAAPRTSPGE